MTNDVDGMKDEELRDYIRRDLEHKEKIRSQMDDYKWCWYLFAIISIIISIITMAWIMQPIDYGW